MRIRLDRQISSMLAGHGAYVPMCGSMIVPLVFHRVDNFPFLGVYISGVVYISWSGHPEGVQLGGRFVHPGGQEVESVGYQT